MTATDDRTAGKWPATGPADLPRDLMGKAQERTEPGSQRRGVWSRLRLHGRTEHATTLPSVPGDQTRADATQYAAAVHAGSQHPALRKGKGVHDGTTAFDSNREIGVTGPGAVVLQMRRPRGDVCTTGCGRPAPFHDPARPGAHWCADCKPSGLTVVDGGKGGVA